MTKVELATLDLPNNNGRIYTTSAIEKAIAINGCRELLGSIGIPAGDSVTQDEIAFTVNNLRIDGNKLVAHVSVIPTPNGHILEQAFDDYAFRTVGYGDVSEDGIVSNFTITSVSAIPKEDAA